MAVAMNSMQGRPKTDSPGSVPATTGSRRREASVPKPALSAAEGASRRREWGLTLVELIVTVAILGILASAAIPVARFEIKRANERELRSDLWMMRKAIDNYKDAADRGGIQTKVDSQNYPPDLQTLVDGVEVQSKKVRFLRRIPIDPMTGKAEWGMRSMQDDPTSDSFGGQNLFDVYSKSDGTALDGTKYSDW
jgi:general secretion pathway protein G